MNPFKPGDQATCVDASRTGRHTLHAGATYTVTEVGSPLSGSVTVTVTEVGSPLGGWVTVTVTGTGLDQPTRLLAARFVRGDRDGRDEAYAAGLADAVAYLLRIHPVTAGRLQDAVDAGTLTRPAPLPTEAGTVVRVTYRDGTKRDLVRLDDGSWREVYPGSVSEPDHASHEVLSSPAGVTR